MTAVLYTDNFAGANANPIGGNWTTGPSGIVTVAGGMQRISNTCKSAIDPSVGFCDAYVNTILGISPDQASKITVTTLGGTPPGDYDFGPMVRMGTSAQSYYAMVYDGQDIFLFAVYGSNNIQIAGPVAHSHISGDVYEVRAVGTLVSGWVNGVMVLSVTDTNVTSGVPGLYISIDTNGGSVTVTRFEADDAQLMGAYLPPPWARAGVGQNRALVGSQFAFLGNQTVPAAPVFTTLDPLVFGSGA